MHKTYLSRVMAILQEVEKTQGPAIKDTAAAFTKAIREHKCIYAFGCNHANLLAKELVYRSGGLVVVNLIAAPGLDLDVRPFTLTTEIERLPDYGAILVRAAGIKAGDVFLIHSVSGRNSVTVDAAMEAKKQGATVICLTNVAYSKSVASRHSSGKRLFEVSDIVLDNCGDIGDAAVDVPQLGQKVAATSTAVGAAILNAVVAEVVGNLIEAGITPPVFLSSNLEGGDAHNEKVLAEYSELIKYL